MLKRPVQCAHENALSIDAAQARILSLVRPIVSEPIDLAAAFGRYLAADVIAHRAQPPFASAAMDGWAVSGYEAGPYKILGESRAGRAFPALLEPGQAVRISTGAPLPEGAIRIVRREHGDQRGLVVQVPDGPAHADVRSRGSDFDQGAVLSRRGDRLDHLAIARLSAGGFAAVQVARRPRVSMLTTGDEIVPPGALPRTDQIYDALSIPLSIRVAQVGGRCSTLLQVPDAAAAFAEALKECSLSDIILLIGGASGGEHDYSRIALRELGFEPIVEAVLMKPGKPFWFAKNEQGQVAVGLPGNPVAALAAAELFLLPYVRAWQGGNPMPSWIDIPASVDTGPKLESIHFGRIDAHGRVEMLGGQDSSALLPLMGANVLIRRRAGRAYRLTE